MSSNNINTPKSLDSLSSLPPIPKFVKKLDPLYVKKINEVVSYILPTIHKESTELAKETLASLNLSSRIQDLSNLINQFRLAYTFKKIEKPFQSQVLEVANDLYLFSLKGNEVPDKYLRGFEKTKEIDKNFPDIFSFEKRIEQIKRITAALEIPEHLLPQALRIQKSYRNYSLKEIGKICINLAKFQCNDEQIKSILNNFNDSAEAMEFIDFLNSLTPCSTKKIYIFIYQFTLNKIAPKELKDLHTLASTLMTDSFGYNSIEYQFRRPAIVDFMLALSKIPQKNRNQVASEIVFLWKEIKHPVYISEAFTQNIHLDFSHLEQTAKHFIQNPQEAKQTLLKALLSFPDDERLSLTEFDTNHMSQIKGQLAKGSYLQALSAIPKESRELLGPKITCLWENATAEHYVERLTLENIPLPQLETFVQIAKPYVIKQKCFSKRADFINLLKVFALDEWEEMAPYIEAIIQNIPTDFINTPELANTFNNLPIHEKKPAFILLNKILKKRESQMSKSFNRKIINTISTHKNNNILQFLQIAEPLLSDLPVHATAEMFRRIFDIDPKEIEGLQQEKDRIKLTKLLAKQSGSDYFLSDDHIQYFQISDPDTLLEVMDLSKINISSTYKINYNNFIINALTPELVNNLLKTPLFEKEIKELITQETPGSHTRSLFEECLLHAYICAYSDPKLIEMNKNAPTQFQEFLLNVLSYRDQSARINMFRFFSDLHKNRAYNLDNKIAKKFFDSATKNLSTKEKKKNLPLFALACANLFKAYQEIDKKMINSLFELVKNNKDLYTDQTKLRIFINLAIQLIETPEMEKEQIEAIIKKMSSSPKDPKNLLKQAKCVISLLGLKRYDLLSELSLKEQSFDQLYLKAFKEICTINDFHLSAEQFTDQYYETIATFRSPENLLVYAGKINELPDDQKSKMQAAFELFVISLLSKNFPNLRYQTNKTDGAPTQIGALSTHYPDLIEAWKKGSCPIDIKELNVQEKTPPQEMSSFEIFKDKIDQNHLGKLAEEDLLIRYFQRREKSETLIKEPKDEWETFQIALIQLCSKTKKATKPELTKLLELYTQTTNPNRQFASDIKDLIKAFDLPQKTITNYKAEDTDHPNDLINLGTEVLGSCQNVDGSPSLNRGLLGYILNGNNRAFVIKSPDGKIQARALVRLLTNNKDEPCLFMERTYTSSDQTLNPYLKAFAIKRAAELKLPLISVDGDGEPSGQLKTEGGIAPYEYVDSAYGITEGAFTIDSGKFVTPQY